MHWMALSDEGHQLVIGRRVGLWFRFRPLEERLLPARLGYSEPLSG
jgi:hypothetical protein